MTKLGELELAKLNCSAAYHILDLAEAQVASVNAVYIRVMHKLEQEKESKV